MPEVTLPTHTAGDVTLPDGTVVWVQTINSVARTQAAKAADLYTAREMRPYRLGGEAYEDKLAYYADIEPQVQADYIAFRHSYEFGAEAFKLYPDPQEPERKDTEDAETYGKRVEAHDKRKADALKKRLEHLNKRQDEEREKALQLSDEARAAECYRLWRRETHADLYEHRFNLEVLCRVVRKADDHAAYVYTREETRPDGTVAVLPDPEAVAALDDTTRARLIAEYGRIDPVKVDQVPISASGSVE